VSIQLLDPNLNGERIKSKNIFWFGKNTKPKEERRKKKKTNLKKLKIFEKKRIGSKEKEKILKKKERTESKRSV
jgi:hypothetical protein